jgi:hypothetical protein
LAEERQRLAREQAKLKTEKKQIKEEKSRLEQAEAVLKQKTKPTEKRKKIQQGGESSVGGELKPEKEKKQLASIPKTVDEKTYKKRDKHRVQFESKPGFYVNQDLGFSVSHPESWVVTNRFGVYSANRSSESSLPNVSIYIIEKPKGTTLEDIPEFILEEARRTFPDSSRHEIVGKGMITLDDGTPAVEYDMKWLWGDGHTRLITTYVVAYRNDKCIYVTSSNHMPLLFTNLSIKKLKAITHSLKFYW